MANIGGVNPHPHQRHKEGWAPDPHGIERDDVRCAAHSTRFAAAQLDIDTPPSGAIVSSGVLTRSGSSSGWRSLDSGAGEESSPFHLKCAQYLSIAGNL